jgi:pimeloyl-ACP methyl ester carboxylesterase
MTVNFEEQTLPVGGVTTFVQSVGKGHPVIFLHGASTLEGFDFVEGLTDRFRVICPHHPGMGRSGPADHVAGMTDLVIHYLDLLDALDLDVRPHLVGFSMGGWLATELAAVAREKFDRIVLMAPAGLNDPAHPMTPIPSIPPAELPAYLSHDPSVAARYFPDGSDPDVAEAFAADRAREGALVDRIAAPHGFGHPNLRRMLARITRPTLVVWGAQDRLLPASQTPLWCDALPDARPLLLEGAGHFVAHERPETMTRIGDFLAS